MAVVEGGEDQQWQFVLPPFLRFLPTDEELLTDYLRNDLVGGTPPRRIHIPFRELYVPGADPWVVQRELAFPHGKSGEFYCYTRRSRRGPGARRTAGSGTWAAKGKDVAVRAKGTGELLGHKLMLKFVPRNGVGANNDDPRYCNWLMHEYRLPDCRGFSSSATPSSSRQFQELVLCKIYQRSSKKEGSPATSEGSEEVSSVDVAAYLTSPC